jgi:hypothetical protein
LQEGIKSHDWITSIDERKDAKARDIENSGALTSEERNHE